jgi:isopenicillin N synthase-like dioxygenase
LKLINHGVSETLKAEVLKASQCFFDLPSEDKKEYIGEKLSDPIRYGTSFNVKVDTTFYWRDFLKCHVHPHFQAPSNPLGFRYSILSLIIF